MEKFTLLAKILYCRRQWRHWQIPPLEKRSWNFQSSWSIGALHINTYSQTYLPWCPCNSLRSHSRSCPISWPPRWTQRRPPLMPTSYWTTSSLPSGRTWGTGLTCNIGQLHFFFLQTLTFVVTHLKWRLRTTRYQESFILFKLLVIHRMKLLASGCILHKHKENMQSTSTSSMQTNPWKRRRLQENVPKRTYTNSYVLEI